MNFIKAIHDLLSADGFVSRARARPTRTHVGTDARSRNALDHGESDRFTESGECSGY